MPRYCRHHSRRYVRHLRVLVPLAYGECLERREETNNVVWFAVDEFAVYPRHICAGLDRNRLCNDFFTGAVVRDERLYCASAERSANGAF